MPRGGWKLGFAMLIAIVMSSIPIAGGAALLPPKWLDCVVALGGMQQSQLPQLPGQPAPKPTWFTEGTGFFYAYLTKGDSDENKREYEVYLVTAAHVIREHYTSQSQSDIAVRVNTKNNTESEFSLPLHPPPSQNGWFFSEHADVAAIRIDLPFLASHGYQVSIFRSDADSADRNELQKLGVSEGDGAYVLGFPMNLAGAQRNYVIVRQATVARISSLYDRTSETFLIDAFAFPGNSGGPVIIRPELTSITGTQALSRAVLAGIVIDYILYDDLAVSLQSKRPRVVFEENSGLADVVPLDFLNDAIQNWRSHQSQPAFPATPNLKSLPPQSAPQ